MQSPSHPESTNSTPRSKAGSWTEETTISTVTTTVTKIRLMCSYGGQIAPRPHDKTLCYLNGDTRMVAVDKNNISLADLVAKIARSLPSTHPRPFVLKYQLPSEDLDSLISVTTDEDLENMIEEHDRIAEVSGNGLKPRRIRIFIFSERKKVGEEPEEENWFVEGLNNGGIVHNSTDSHGSSVNYLLGLEEDDRGLNHHHSNNNNNNHSSCSSVVTESVAMTTMPTLRTSTLQVDAFSSFESSASSPSSNLPPIKVRVDDNQNQRSGLDEGFAQMGIYSEQKPDENFGGNLFDHQNHLQSSQNPIMSAVSLPTKFTDNITVSESFPKTYSSADQKSPLPPIQPPEPLHQERTPQISTTKQDNDDHSHSAASDSNYRQHQILPDQTYGVQPHHNYEQQYIQVPQMIPMPSQSPFFQVQQPHMYNQNGPIFYIPIQRPPNMTGQPPHPQHFAVQPQMSDHLSKSQFVGTTTQLPPHLMHIGGRGREEQPKQYVGYGYESLRHQPQTTETAAIFYSQAAAVSASSTVPPQYQTLKSSEQPR